MLSQPQLAVAYLLLPARSIILHYRDKSAYSQFNWQKLVALEGVAPSRITAFEAGRSAISGYPQGHLKLVEVAGLEPCSAPSSTLVYDGIAPSVLPLTISLP